MPYDPRDLALHLIVIYSIGLLFMAIGGPVEEALAQAFNWWYVLGVVVMSVVLWVLEVQILE